MQLLSSKKKQRREGRRHVRQAKYLSDKPTDHLQTCGPFLQEFVNNIRKSGRMDLVKNGLIDLHGKHFAIDYKEKYGFQQGWQSDRGKSETTKVYSNLLNENKIVNSVQLVLTIWLGVCLWFLSVYRVFQMGTLALSFAGTAIAMEIVDTFIEAMIVPEDEENIEKSLSIKQLAEKYTLSIFFILYMIVIMLESSFTEDRSFIPIPIDFFFMAKIYKRFRALCLLIKIRMPAGWRNQMEICQLILGCLSVVSFFSLVLYLAPLAHPIDNWTLQISHFNGSWFQKYIYSLYFTCSTMFTVGYGDIAPKNMYEIATILVVQIVGIINNGYVINEVGRYLSKINEEEDLFYRSISDAEKIAQSYCLPKELSKKILSSIVDNQIVNNRFNVEEEDKFINQLTEDLRYDVTGFNKFKLIKTNIFFVCHWTKSFQRTVANKLIRHLYTPDQTLPQIQGKEKLYILSRGKIDIETTFSSKTAHHRKILATLEIDPKKQVFFNVYGYTALISGLKVKLKAIARDYSICYYIDKDSFLSAVAQSQTDFEYFHEIRSKIEESNCKQAFEAPKIKSTKEHYNPSTYFIVKRSGRIEAGKQPRNSYLKRRETKNKRVIQADIFETEKSIRSPSRKKLSIDRDILQSLDISAQVIQFVHSSRNKIRNLGTGIWVDQVQLSKQRIINEKFESGHEFNYFRKKFNAKKRLEKYNRLNTHNTHSQDCIQMVFRNNAMRFDNMNLNEETLLRLMNTKNF